MTNLEPRADKAVRDAVDAFMDGRYLPDFQGETVFETKNSRYRLVDGVVISAPDPSLHGAELVGWLNESQRRCLVESHWQPGARAVLVDRRIDRNIIVTSTTRLLHAEDAGSSSYQGGSAKSHSDFRSWHPPPMERAPTPLPIIPATPLPPAIAAPNKRAVHLPPRPIMASARVPAPPASPRPLPLPTPPPRREIEAAALPAPPAPVIEAVHVPPPPAAPAEWEITSAEMEIVDPAEVAAAQAEVPEDSATNIPIELVRPAIEGPESATSSPFPLVRPI